MKEWPGDGEKEARFALWRQPPPPDPILPRRLVKLRWERAVFVSACVVVIVLTAARAPLALVPVICVLGAVFWQIQARVWSRRAHLSVADLMDLPASGAQFPVRVVFRADEVRYGSDDGVVTFVGPWLTFQGLKTDFAVQRSDVGLGLPSRPTHDNEFVGEPLRIRYSIEGVAHRVLIAPYDGVEGGEQGLHRRFTEAVRQWQNEGTALPGEATYPPQEVMPGATASAIRWCWAAVASMPLVFAASVLFCLSISAKTSDWWPVFSCMWIPLMVLMEARQRYRGMRRVELRGQVHRQALPQHDEDVLQEHVQA